MILKESLPYNMKAKKIAIINGPNLNLLGKREPDIYGTTSFDEYLEILVAKYPEVELSYYQSNVEGALVDAIQHFGFNSDAIILNAAGYSHTSVAIADAVSAVPATVVEVHISNIFARESFRHTSLLSAVCKGIVCGFGLKSYDLALKFLLEQ